MYNVLPVHVALQDNVTDTSEASLTTTTQFLPGCRCLAAPRRCTITAKVCCRRSLREDSHSWSQDLDPDIGSLVSPPFPEVAPPGAPEYGLYTVKAGVAGREASTFHGSYCL